MLLEVWSLMKCWKCQRKFPDRLLSPMMISGGWTKPICPLCALEMRNAYHGLPKDEPFTGTQACANWQEAKKLYA